MTPFLGIGVGGRTYDYRDLHIASRTVFDAYGVIGNELGIGATGLRFEVRD